MENRTETAISTDSEVMENWAAKLATVRASIKALEVTESFLKHQLESSWGPIVLRSETRRFGKVSLSAGRRQTKKTNPQELKDYLTMMGQEDLYDEVTEVSVSNKKVAALVKKELLEPEVLELAKVTSSYVQWRVKVGEK